ncbi:Alpha/Beta hydrolase protein [Flammula alnicola]|nr:Alpha/Beta hydrolase protein [Flammula alnicola]
MQSFGHWLLSLTFLGIVQATATPFKPSEYPKETAHCKAIRRGEVDEIVDIQLKYVDINPDASTTLLMVHGWPSLWSTWSKQIEEFKEDYHLIVPDLRGFGESTHPGEPQSSGTLGDMVSDLVCILEHAKVTSAVCIGHDWGSPVCYEAARLRPDIFTAVVGVVTPYIPSAGPFVPVENLLPLFPALTYQLFFDRQMDAAIAELDKDIRRTVRATLRTVASAPPSHFLKNKDSFLAAWDEVEQIEPVPFFSPEEEDYFVEQYRIQGFKNTLQFYAHKNRYEGWNLANSQGNHTLSQPVLAVYPTEDPVANWVLAAKTLTSAEFLPNLTTELLPGSHWVHIEYPQEFNTILRKWLNGIKEADVHKQEGHLDDEL